MCMVAVGIFQAYQHMCVVLQDTESLIPVMTCKPSELITVHHCSVHGVLSDLCIKGTRCLARKKPLITCAITTHSQEVADLSAHKQPV